MSFRFICEQVSPSEYIMSTTGGSSPNKIKVSFTDIKRMVDSGEYIYGVLNTRNGFKIRVFNTIQDIKLLYEASCRFSKKYFELEEPLNHAGELWLKELKDSGSVIKIPQIIQGYYDCVFCDQYCDSGNRPPVEQIIFPKYCEELSNGACCSAQSLKNVQLPINLKWVGDKCFDYCTSLNEINFPEGLISIGEAAFRSCRMLSHVKLPSSVKEIRSYGFSCCGLRDIKLNEGLEIIGDYCFSGCYLLQKLNIPSSVVELGYFDIVQSGIRELIITKDLYEHAVEQEHIRESDIRHSGIKVLFK